jgi:AraC-like DNA-binding protein
MNIALSVPDILLFTTSILLVFNIILLLRKVNSKNYMLVGALTIYFGFITATIVLLLFTRYNIKIINSGTILTLMAIVYSLYNVFHYFSLQQLIDKKNRFNVKYLLHLASVIIVGFLIFYFFQPISLIKGDGYSYVFETQHLMVAQGKNYIILLSRIFHPIFYAILGGYLLFSFYNSPRYLSIQKSTRYFIFFFYLQKIFLFIWVLIGYVGFNIDNELFSKLSITGFSITALFMSSYILLSPNLLLQIIKPSQNSKKIPIAASKLPDLIGQLGRMMDQYKFYLDANYSLTNLSSDTDISANTIREVIAASGFKNFSAYINSFRIAHAEQLISNGYLDTYSIESLCKDSGFQSEVTFYRVFKKVHDCTPKEFSYNIKSIRFTS